MTTYLRQAIRTNVYSDRNGNYCASATCQRGRFRGQVPPNTDRPDACHSWAMAQLVARFVREDGGYERSGFGGQWVGGILPDGTGAWVQLEPERKATVPPIPMI
jgi:hypothetical protein